MDFGKVLDQEVTLVNFTLPPDGWQTDRALPGKKASKQAFFVGCAKWGRKEWVNLIYPTKTKEALFLDEYVKHFNSIELNAAFYSIPKPELIRKWRGKAEDNAEGKFLFCPKFSRTISHMKRLKDAAEVTDSYLASVSEFGPYLGPCFLQLSDNFSANSYGVLEKYLHELPGDLDIFIELRHQSWFADREIRRRVFDLLSKLKKGVIITDSSGRRDCVHMELTIPEVFIRFVGNGALHQASDFARVDEWVSRISNWVDRGLEKVYFFLHQQNEKDTPILANYTIQQFNKHLNAEIAELKFITKQP